HRFCEQGVCVRGGGLEGGGLVTGLFVEQFGRRILVARELPDDVRVRRSGRQTAGGSGGRLRHEDLVGQLRIGFLDRSVRRDRIVDPRAAAGGQESVVAGVVPR